ncbi:MAG: transposase family protein, partial [Firmicutes bacterium]|nr:transposase family protein [Bacillota bacterium]
TWDITYLRAAVKGSFYYLYLIIDVFSRDIVGWEVWEEESADHASDLIRRTCIAQGRLTIEPLVLHSDYTDK